MPNNSRIDDFDRKTWFIAKNPSFQSKNLAYRSKTWILIDKTNLSDQKTGFSIKKLAYRPTYQVSVDKPSLSIKKLGSSAINHVFDRKTWFTDRKTWILGDKPGDNPSFSIGKPSFSVEHLVYRWRSKFFDRKISTQPVAT